MPSCSQFHFSIVIAALRAQPTSKQFFPVDHEGVTCRSITQVWRYGTGSYAMRRPALLEREDGIPAPGDVPDDAIMADHNAAVTPPLNNHKFLRSLLRDHVLSADISPLRREATGDVVAPLSVENSIELGPGEKVTAEIVVFNRKAAHTFPTEIRDFYEP